MVILGIVPLQVYFEAFLVVKVVISHAFQTLLTLSCQLAFTLPGT